MILKKKFTKNIILFLTATIVSISTVACAENDDNKTANQDIVVTKTTELTTSAPIMTTESVTTQEEILTDYFTGEPSQDGFPTDEDMKKASELKRQGTFMMAFVGNDIITYANIDKLSVIKCDDDNIYIINDYKKNSKMNYLNIFTNNKIDKNLKIIDVVDFVSYYVAYLELSRIGIEGYNAKEEYEKMRKTKPSVFVIGIDIFSPVKDKTMNESIFSKALETSKND